MKVEVLCVCVWRIERDALGKRSRENSAYLSLSTNIMCVLMWRREVWESLKRDGIEEMAQRRWTEREGRERRLLDDSFPLERKHSLTIHEHGHKLQVGGGT